MLAGFIVGTWWSIGSHGEIGCLLPDHKRSIDVSEDVKWEEPVIILLGKYNGQSGKWDGWDTFSETMQFSLTSLFHIYMRCSQFGSPLRQQENLCVYRCICASMCVYGVEESILLKFVIDILSVSRRYREKHDILWSISNLILGRWREIVSLWMAG